MFTGHRPDKLPGGYDMDSGSNKEVVRILEDTVTKLYEEYGIVGWWSGGALGGDSLFFKCIDNLKNKGLPLKNCLALPFDDMGSEWPDSSVSFLEWSISMADTVVNVGRHNGASKSKEAVARLLLDRNIFMIQRSSICLALYDEYEGVYNGGTRHAVNNARKSELDLVIVNPKMYQINTEVSPRGIRRDLERVLAGKSKTPSSYEAIIELEKKDGVGVNPFSNIFT